MPTKSDLIRQAEQGERVKEIRESLKLTGEAFGERLQRLAAGVGIDATYGKDKISRIESGRQAISSEELILIARLDTQQRGVDWIAFGVKQGRGKPVIPEQAKEETASPPRKRAAGQ